MKLRPSTLDRIASAYAEAVASGDFASAEGWLATASFVAEREAARSDRRASRQAARPGVLLGALRRSYS